MSKDVAKRRHDPADDFPRLPPGRRPKLAQIMRDEPALYQKALAWIREGCYAHVVAQALGVTAETFIRWKAKGREAKTGLYRQFYEDVVQATAQARLDAERRVWQNDPKFWLRSGPGKETNAGEDDWSDERQTVDVNLHGAEQIGEAIGASTVAGALKELEAAGLIAITDQGRGMLEYVGDDSLEGEIVDVESQSVDDDGQPRGNGQA